ncbi:MAG: cadherin-like beta sandwich domain-containing protein [Bacillota bacterium]|nr:cadherin-like beta sandwich domain-containing protein [Bacillota bacterium]MDW7684481.1 cadherin-like beta sandwich domain-containing protein [Bacillota bacterium]
MKKIFFLVLFCLLITPSTVLAASASLTGPGTVRAGDTITLTFSLSGTGILGGSGTLSYDSSQLTLTGTSRKIASPWVVEPNGNKLVFYDNNLTSPINSKKAIFTATFKVSNSVATGTKITVSSTGTTATDGKADANIGTVSYSTTIAAPLSKNANLSAMTVSNATLSPAFSTSRTSYTTTVPYSVKSLNVTATKEDPGAKVSISGTSLSVGKNTVSVKVTAASGATKTYTITATREQDPNYVPSNDANLESISIDNGILSPEFSVEHTGYIVYLPYEITSFTASGKAVDAKVKSVTGETKELSEGENEVTITVTAEDGTTKVYTITVVRMPEYGVEPVNDPTDPEETDPENSDTEIIPEIDEQESAPEEPQTAGIPVWFAVMTTFIGIPIGAGSLILFNRDKYGKHSLKK